MKKIGAWAGVIIALVTIVGFASSLDGRYAKADQVNRIETKVDLTILKLRMEAVQERMWKIEDRQTEKFVMEFNRYPTSAELVAYMPEVTRDQYRALCTEYADLEAQIKALTGGS